MTHRALIILVAVQFFLCGISVGLLLPRLFGG